MNDSNQKGPTRYLVLAGTLWLLCGAGLDFFNVAWGTGNWLGQFSLKWFFIFLVFALASVILLSIVGMVIWIPEKFLGLIQYLLLLRDRLGLLRWLFAALLMILPVYLIQYTYWGIVFHGHYLRVFVFAVNAIIIGWLITGVNNKGFLSWNGILTALILTSGFYNFFVPLISVTNYPFSLGWSEGNRLWDYSILFGRHLYNYPANQSIPVYLEIGRQFVGGIPFLVSGVNLWEVRLWVALTDVVPYLILGWLAFRLTKKNALLWMLAGIWAFAFVEQGPIHPPLLICAIIVALAWERPLWLAIPLILAASYFAQISRSTWLFAPGMWSVMLVMGDAILIGNKLDKKTWARAISIGLAGITGGYLAPFLVPTSFLKSIGPIADQSAGIVVNSGVTLSSVQTQISAQPLLWYRLLPNATYRPGILIGLLFACAPLIAIVAYLVKKEYWKPNGWQKFSIIAPLSAFLVVGLIVSVKIGGGGDLHNMDMFIIGLMFTGALAWRRTFYQQLDIISAMPAWFRISLIAMIAVPAYNPLILMAPISTKADIGMIAKLADITPADPLPDPLPNMVTSEQDASTALDRIRQVVIEAAPTGDVLFMDQRQLLTFGFIQNVKLVPEYDKKVLIDKALSRDLKYFKEFYKDLADHRFSLIITSPLHEQLNSLEDQFSDENNAWVKWVAAPILCYYQSGASFKKVRVELLVPREQASECDSLPSN